MFCIVLISLYFYLYIELACLAYYCIIVIAFIIAPHNFSNTLKLTINLGKITNTKLDI